MGDIKEITTTIGTLAPAERPAASPVRHSLLDQIGNTPLLYLRNIAREFPNIEFYAKAEWFNPGGSKL